MKAIRLPQTGDAELLELIDRPIPDPGPHDLRLRVMAAGVNYADVLVRRGLYQPMPDMPAYPGLEVAGTVDAVGDRVTRFRPGDRVVANVPAGGYAQYALTREAMAAALPDDIDFDLAAGLPVAGMTAYHLTHTVAAPEPGQFVVDYAAAGAVGSVVIGLAKTRGARVIALVGSAEKAARALELGADWAIDYRAETDVPARVRELTAGHGADVIYDSVFGAAAHDDLAMAAPRARIVWYGIAGGLPNSKKLLAAMLRRFTDSPTMSLYHLISSLRFDAARHAAGWPELFAALRSGRARLPLAGVYPLAEAARAHRKLESRATMGKLVLRPWD
ncbi:MAG: zinc-binding dehydrogenase [Myxococcales bacterium]|nr:zinc-binding dehydrogenase [Myxococcales bacterium]